MQLRWQLRYAVIYSGVVSVYFEYVCNSSLSAYAIWLGAPCDIASTIHVHVGSH